MSTRSRDESLRWGDVVTEGQRQRLLAQTIAAMRELLEMPERRDIIGSVSLVDKGRISYDGTPVITSSGLAIRETKAVDSYDILWLRFKLILGINVDFKEVPEPGPIHSYTHLETDQELCRLAEDFRISAGDIKKVAQLLKV